jgi:hypothetical protein
VAVLVDTARRWIMAGLGGLLLFPLLLLLFIIGVVILPSAVDVRLRTKNGRDKLCMADTLEEGGVVPVKMGVTTVLVGGLLLSSPLSVVGYDDDLLLIVALLSSTLDADGDPAGDDNDPRALTSLLLVALIEPSISIGSDESG